MAQGLVPVPPLFRGHLRQIHGPLSLFLDHHPVAADLDRLRTRHPGKRGEHGYFHLQRGQFHGADRTEAPVAQGRLQSHSAHREGQRRVLGHVADAAAQLPVFLKGHERPPSVPERRRESPRQRHGSRVQIALHRLPRQLQQILAIRVGEPGRIPVCSG